MKIENSTKPSAGTKTGEVRSSTAGKSAQPAQPAQPAQTGGGASVQLSKISAQLQSSNDTSVFDVARVSQIKQAISDGKFQINAAAIADRLISSARELVDAERQG